MLLRWPAAVNAAWPESRRPTPSPCRPNTCAPRRTLQKVEDLRRHCSVLLGCLPPTRDAFLEEIFLWKHLISLVSSRCGRH